MISMIFGGRLFQKCSVLGAFPKSSNGFGGGGCDALPAKIAGRKRMGYMAKIFIVEVNFVVTRHCPFL